MACERITQAIVTHHVGERPVKAVFNPCNPSGSTRHVRFTTSKKTYKTDARYCHINHAVCDSDWKARFCLVAEGRPRVRTDAKNHGLSLEAPAASETSHEPTFPTSSCWWMTGAARMTSCTWRSLECAG